MILPKLTIYSDGSFHQKLKTGGWASIIIHDEMVEEFYGKVEKTNSSNRMEMLAIINALEKVQSSSEITIFTDYQTIAIGFSQKLVDKWKSNDWKSKHGKDILNKDLWKRIADLSTNHKIDWRWIPSHSGNFYNDYCDRLASEARKHL